MEYFHNYFFFIIGTLTSVKCPSISSISANNKFLPTFLIPCLLLKEFQLTLATHYRAKLWETNEHS